MREFFNKKRFQFANANLLVAFIAILILSLQVKVQAQNPAFPVKINIHVNSPVPPFLPMLEQDLTGGAGSFTDRVVGSIQNTGNSPLKVKLYATLERISPAPLSIGLSPSYQAEIPIILPPQHVEVITQSIVYQAFDGFKFSSLVFQGTSLNELKGHGLNYKIPEGTYRLCLDAYDFEVMGKSAPLSLVGTSCGVFQICYSAAAPSIQLPVNSNMGYEFQDYTSYSSLINFSWIPPTTTCGAILPNFNYNLEIFELIEGEAINDVLYNPPLFQDGNIHNTTYLLDTIMYPNIFKDNHKYVVRVRANILNPQSFLELQNNGFSEVATFTYKIFDPSDDKEDEVVEEAEDPEEGAGEPEGTEDLTDGTGPTEEVSEEDEEEDQEPLIDLPLVTNECAESDISSNEPLARKLVKTDVVRVGDFEMKVDENVVLNDGKHTGTGYIMWSPYGIPIPLAVKFEGIKINKDMQLIDGLVKTVLDDNFTELKNIETSFANTIAKLKRSDINNIRSRINGANRKLNTIVENSTRLHFPIGIEDEKIDDKLNGTFLISNIVFSSQGTNMNVYLGIDNANNGEGVISLGGTNLCIEPEGFSMKDAAIYLVRDRSFNIDGNKLTLKAPENGVFTGSAEHTDNSTFATWDSEGKFEEVVVNAEVIVSKNYILPLDDDGNRLDSAVVLNTNFTFKEWDDWVAKLEVTSPFEITAFKGFSIQAGENIYYDHSNVRNVEAFETPVNYNGEKSEMFMGLYIPSLILTIPNNFTDHSANATTVDFNNFIIDGKGVSTTISATDVLDIQTGSLGGWGVSIDTINVSIINNAPNGEMEMTGGIKVPIAEEPLGYSCLLSTNSESDEEIDFEFRVEPSGPIDFTAWKAYLSISEESKFSIVSSMGKTSIQAEFHGSMGLDINVPKVPKLKFPDLNFENMTIANAAEIYDDQIAELKKQGNKIEEELHFFIESLKFGGQELINFTEEEGDDNIAAEEEEQPEIAGFNFSIDSSRFKKKYIHSEKKLEVSLSLGVSLDLGFGKSFIISGKAKGLKLTGDLYANKAPKFGGVDVGSVGLKGEFGPVSVDGSIDFMSDDEDFGNGIKGALTVDFPPGISLNSRVIIGTKEDSEGPIKYFGLAANVYLKSGLAPIGPIVVNGFGGGFYNNMKIEKTGLADIAATSEKGSADNVPLKVERGAMTIDAQVSLSFINSTILKASVGMKGSVHEGSLTNLKLEGQGNIISDGGKESEGVINANVELDYVVKDRSFDGFLEVNTKLFTASANIPVWAHVSPKLDSQGEQTDDYKYWLYIGHPGTGEETGEDGNVYERIKVTLVNDSIKNSSVFLGGDAYFCTGNVLPPVPQLPPNVAELFDLTAENNSLISAIQGSMGQSNPGFMFGASVRGKLDLQLAMFYAKIEATVGFDVDLRRVSDPGDCANVDGSFGLNNWYGMGQMYAFFDLDVGFKVNVWFYKGNVSLAKFTTGAKLEAGLPNPTWMRGDVRVRGSVLNGLIKVNANCRVEVGEPCLPGIDPLEDIQLISEVGPEGDDASVFANPYIVFSMPMEETIVDIRVPSTDPGKPEPIDRRYKFMVDTLAISKITDTGKELVDGVAHRYNKDKHALTLATTVAFDPNSKYEIFIQCSAHEYDKSLEKWGHPKEHQPHGLTQDTIVYYYTGDAPDTIAEKHVVFSYPKNNQKYLLKDEFSRMGVIKIDKHVDSYFNNKGITYDYLVTFVDNGPREYATLESDDDFEIPDNLGDINININPEDLIIPVTYKNIKSEPFHYNEGTREISFQIPPSLQNDRMYDVIFVVREKGITERISQSKDIDLVKRNEDNSANNDPGSKGNKGDDINDRYNKGREGGGGGVFTPNNPQGNGRGGNTGGGAPNPTYQNPDQHGRPGFNSGENPFDPNILTDYGTDLESVSGVDERNNLPGGVEGTQTSSTSAIRDTFTLVGHELSTYAVGRNERVIYKMSITTSKYSTIQEKLNSFNGFNTQVDLENGGRVDNTNITYNELEIKTTNMSEAFDGFELYGYEKVVGHESSSFHIKTPALLNASVIFRPSKANDDKMDVLYNTIAKLKTGEFSVELGADIVRRGRSTQSKDRDVPTRLIQGVMQQGKRYPNLHGPDIFDLLPTDIDKNLIIKNDRDKYYAHDYMLLQKTANYYFNNMGTMFGPPAFGSGYNSGARTMGNSTIGGEIEFRGVILGPAYTEVMNDILNLEYTKMKVTDPRRIQFEYGYSLDMYEHINPEYKDENDGANEPLGTQVPASHKRTKKVNVDL